VRVTVRQAGADLRGCEETRPENVIQPTLCRVPDTQPYFGFNGPKPSRCKEHIEDGMINLKHKRCKLCPTQTKNPKHKGYCFRCFIYTFPNEPVSRFYKKNTSQTSSRKPTSTLMRHWTSPYKAVALKGDQIA
jgi:hypothetical protein